MEFLTLAAAGAAGNENSGASTIATLAVGGTANVTGATFQTSQPLWAQQRLIQLQQFVGPEFPVSKLLCSNDFGDVVSASASQTVTLATTSSHM